MNILKRFSIANWSRQFATSCRRFPVALCLLLFLTCFLVFMNHGGKVESHWQFFYIFYPATGALLAVSLRLLTEDFKSRVMSVVTQVVAHAAWLGISVYLTQFDKFSLPQFIAVAATIVTMVLSVFLLCFYRRNDDVPFWNFSVNVLVAIGAGCIVGGVLTLGLILFVQSLDWLFGISIDDCVFADIPSVCMVLLAPLLTMNLIPDGEDKRISQVASYPGFINGVIQYLFIPLLLLYMATLYIYAIKILTSWQLPVGWVCYLVSASMLGMVAVIYLTYPLQHEQGNTFFRQVTRWMPLAMIPLLALMTVAIGRRLSDYGITVSRLYVLVFNIWCYVVCIGLLLVRNKRIWWVPALFAVVLFLISVGPQSIPNITQRQLLDEARKAFAATVAGQLPLSGEQYNRWLDSVDPKVAAAIDGKLDYLDRDFGYVSVSALVGRDVITGAYSIEKGAVDYTLVNLNYYNNDMIAAVIIPQGFTTVSVVNVQIDTTLEKGNDKLQLIVESPIDAHKEYRFELTIKQFADLDKEKNPDRVQPIVARNQEAVLMINQYAFHIYGNLNCSVTCSGILFTR